MDEVSDDNCVEMITLRRSKCKKRNTVSIDVGTATESGKESSISATKRQRTSAHSSLKKVKFSKRGANEPNLYHLEQMKIAEYSTQDESKVEDLAEDGSREKSTLEYSKKRQAPELQPTLHKHRQFNLIQNLAHVATYAGALKVTNLISEQEEVLIHAEDIRDEGAFISASTAFELVLQAEAELAFANLKEIIAYLVFAAAICR